MEAKYVWMSVTIPASSGNAVTLASLIDDVITNTSEQERIISCEIQGYNDDIATARPAMKIGSTAALANGTPIAAGMPYYVSGSLGALGCMFVRMTADSADSDAQLLVALKAVDEP